MAYVVTAVWRSKAGREGRLIEVIEQLTIASRSEPGNLLYQPHRSPEDGRLFYFYEQYVDEKAFLAHNESEHFTRLVKQEAIPELLDDRQRAFFTTMLDDSSDSGAD